MNLIRTVASAVLLTTGLAAMSPAPAAIISGTLDFSATYPDFPPPLPPPTPTVFGSISITFDNSADISQTTTGIAIISLNIPLGSAVAFTYSQSLDLLRIGGIETGVGGVFAGSFDFLLGVNSISTSPSPNLFQATFADNILYGFLDQFTVTFTPTREVPVPEPMSLALLGVGLAGLAVARRRRPAGRDQLQAV